MATPQVKDLVLRSPAGSTEVVTFPWPLQIGTGQDKHDNGIDIIDTIKFVCDELPGISSAFEEINLNQVDTACYKTMTNLVDRFNKAVDSIVALEKGTSLPAERLNKFAHPSLLRHILQLVYNFAVLDPDKLNNYEPFSPEVYGETSYELVQQMIDYVRVAKEDTFIDLGSGVGQVVLQMAGSFPLKTCVGIEKADTPARYAERMDIYFRQFMAWFGKRYCDYKLLRGDFLVDEHREKITSSSLVFVNNFAFGPHVDHQLKERFADLRDGARIVSSKSFCPLNFRITDRNLSDIGTIMNVSEIPPLKGSVSWTCKPVSYYLHVIDRTILERYFQRLKTQKGAENEHVGSTRTTRDRAKREANNQAAMHHSNSNSSSATNRTNSPANVNNHHTVAAAAAAAAAKSTRHHHQLQQQQQRSLDMDTSTESDGDALALANGDLTTQNGSSGPTTRKVWSDWCSSKGKSSQSDDEENNNFSSTTNSRNARATTQKKRKKLTRKAAIASKSAAAAQREAAAREREEAAAIALVANSKESSSKEDGGGGSTGPGKGRKGRMKKGGRGRKSLKIVGLDVLHKQTLLSTSVEVMSKKLPPAPGCVDQQLTSLLTGDMSHTELDIPAAPQDTPYALQILLDVFRSQYMAMIEHMKSKAFVPNIKRQIQLEQERKQRIKNRASQLDKQIKVLIDDSVALLKVRMNELGINVSSPNDLIAKAKEIVSRHKELQGIAKKIQSDVSTCELEQKRLLKRQMQHLPEYQKVYGLASGGNGKTKLELAASAHDLCETAAHELVLKEIANTLAQRKKLYAQVSTIEKEAIALEKAAEERRTAAALLAQGTNMTLANVPATAVSSSQAMMPATITPANTAGVQPLQLTTSNTNANTNTTATSNSAVPNNSAIALTTKSSNHASKTTRRSRDHRTRSQEWPDVPDVGKIEESNPEVLAQKILETGRQIEAGKFMTGGATNYAGGKQALHQHNSNSNPHNEEKRAHKHQRSSSNEQLTPAVSVYMGPQDSTLMPAPAASSKNQQNMTTVATGAASATPVSTPNSMRVASLLPRCELPGSRKSNSCSNNSSIQESPKVANFEDRLKSIITSALNEDQEHRKAAAHQLPSAHSPQQPPAPKRSKHAAAQQHLMQPQQQPQVPSNINSIITVATQGLTHLNATTTISPITPPPMPAAATHYASSKYASSSNKQPSSSSSLSNAQKFATSVNAVATKESAASSAAAAAAASKYHHHTQALTVQQQQQQHQQQLAHMQQLQQSMFAAAAAAAAAPADMAFNHRRRNSVSAATYEQFVAQQMAAVAAAATQHHQQAAVSATNAAQHHHNMLPLEFKAPTAAENLIAAAQRSGSREMLEEVAPRSSSANSDSAIMYFPPTRDRLLALERSTSRESAASQPLPPHQGLMSGQQPQPSRPSSNSSQPDYTQVSPAKMALRRHLSQEKLNQQLPTAGGGNAQMSSKTIGDLVNGEIERTLEISHQSIINAAINMSTVGTAAATTASGNNAANERNNMYNSSHYAELESAQDRSHERLLINPNAQRPERVHVRVPDEAHNNYATAEISPRGRKSPHTHNLVTLAHVAYNHKAANAAAAITDVGVNMKLATTNSTTAVGNVATQARNYSNRDSNAATSYQQLSNREAVGARNAMGRGRVSDYQTVALPRAEMKGCIEAYFNEEEQQRHQQPHQQPHKSGGVNKERNAARGGRLNGGNAPLEGLAASLQDHVMAARKFKEENEERQRRAAAAAAATSTTTNNELQQQQQQLAAHHYGNHLTQLQQQYQNQQQQHIATHNHNGGTPLKVEIGHKRPFSSTNQPRPSKVPHYAHEPTLPQQQQQHNPYANSNGGLHIAAATTTPNSRHNINNNDSNKLPIEPLLMSPEINSIMCGEEQQQQQAQQRNASLQLAMRQQQQQQQQAQSSSSTNSTPIVGARATDDGKHAKHSCSTYTRNLNANDAVSETADISRLTNTAPGTI